MTDLLFLAHRIPYPPDKGDKIRSWHILKYLSERYTVHLGCFIDDPADWDHTKALRERCEECRFVSLFPTLSRLRSLRGFLAGVPLTLPYYRDSQMLDWVSEIGRRRKPAHVFVYGCAMAQYLDAIAGIRSHYIIDFVDVDSDKWRQYAQRSNWPLSWIYRREHRTLLGFERRMALQSKVSLFASKAEADLFRGLVPEASQKVMTVSNGVDCEFFSPDIKFPDPYRGEKTVAVFTGTMDYRPNIDAVTYFAAEVFPRVRRRIPEALFYIVGARPTSGVIALARIRGVVVTGRVSDVRPYLAFAKVAVVPLQIARGIQNKVLEAMAMARPVVVTKQALQGIGAEVGKEVLLADGPEEFADIVSNVMTRPCFESIGKCARQRVLSEFGWQSRVGRLESIFGDGVLFSNR